MFSGISIGMRIFIAGAIAFVIGFVGFFSGLCELIGFEFPGMFRGALLISIPFMVIGLAVMFFTYKALFEEN